MHPALRGRCGSTCPRGSPVAAQGPGAQSLLVLSTATVTAFSFQVSQEPSPPVQKPLFTCRCGDRRK